MGDLADVADLSPDGCAALFMAMHAARAHSTKLFITHRDDRTRSVPLQIGLARALSIRNGDGS